jgi:hypothetical protein
MFASSSTGKLFSVQEVKSPLSPTALIYRYKPAYTAAGGAYLVVPLALFSTWSCFWW